MGRDANQYAPIFVLATARSYSSVVSTMIGQHPDLFGFPELKLFACPTIGDLDRSLSDAARTAEFAYRSPGLMRAVAQLAFGDQSTRSLARAQRWVRERAGWSGAAVFDLLMEFIRPRVAVEKSPEHVLRQAALERVVHAYPRARFIHLTRHPLTATASMQSHMQLTDPHAATFCFYSWYDINFRIEELGARLPSHRYLRVRAEDVLNDSEPHLQRIATWLGLPADKLAIETMHHPERSPFARFGPPDSGVSGGNDHAFLRDPVPHRVECPLQVERPNDWTGPPRLWTAIVELADRLGYP